MAKPRDDIDEWLAAWFVKYRRHSPMQLWRKAVEAGFSGYQFLDAARRLPVIEEIDADGDSVWVAPPGWPPAPPTREEM
jgi:hypothetical protein